MSPNQHEADRVPPAGRLRPARMDDVAAVQRLINTSAERGEMLPRSLAELYDNLRDFVLWEQDGHVVACCALHVTWADLAEVKSLGVADPAQGSGIGTALVRRCIEDARALGVRRIFALTYQPEFFVRLGFDPIDKSLLPHKVWAECTRCVKFPDCDEKAVQLELDDPADSSTGSSEPDNPQR